MFLLLPFHHLDVRHLRVVRNLVSRKFKPPSMRPGLCTRLVHQAGGAGLIWAYLHHFIAGLRHLWMDVSHDAVTKEFGKTSALFTLVSASA
jgi:succinate dehydrogenase / fumarate reductase cytochrome b subunit